MNQTLEALRWLAAIVQSKCHDSNMVTIGGVTRTVGDLLDSANEILAQQQPLRSGQYPSDEQQVKDMATLIKRLAAQLRKAEPAGKYARLSDEAVDYLRRHGLEGSPMRGDDNG